MTFKVGDKVYLPNSSNMIYTLCRNTNKNSNLTHPFYLYTNGIRLEFTEDGKLDLNDLVPCIFHATVVNRFLLEGIYNFNFQDPTGRLKGEETLVFF